MSASTLSDFDYDLPEQLIAQYPPPRREDARLMGLGRAHGEIAHGTIPDLVELLPEGALLVVNDTRVFPARLPLQRQSGGAVEVLLLEVQPGTDTWLAMTRSSKTLREGETLHGRGGEGALVEFCRRLDGGRAVVRLLQEDLPQLVGEVPLPPYIRRPAEDGDKERYQTIFADREGSVAAPTAGLHLTDALINALASQKGISMAKVTLHVGPGTFAPVRVENLADHQMHEERYEISPETAQALALAKEQGRPVIAVGTTSVRTLEGTGGEAGSGRTSLFIQPGFEFRVVDGLLTNFHLPRSTLLMLVSAFMGRERMLGAYAEAVAQKYRFFSYGDAMLIL